MPSRLPLKKKITWLTSLNLCCLPSLPAHSYSSKLTQAVLIFFGHRESHFIITENVFTFWSLCLESFLLSESSYSLLPFKSQSNGLHQVFCKPSQWGQTWILCSPNTADFYMISCTYHSFNFSVTFVSHWTWKAWMMPSSASYYPEQCLANEYLNLWLFTELFWCGILVRVYG